MTLLCFLYMNKNRFNNQKRNTQKNIGQPCLEYRFRQVYRLVSSELFCDPLLACHPCESEAEMTVPYKQVIYQLQIVNRYYQLAISS